MSEHPFRQIHLDFHTSEHIPSVGSDFDPDAFVARLQKSKVESVVLFSKCHHGWSYYDSEIGERHPSLSFDLLRAQYDACKAAGIKVPIYISVGWDERNARLHQDWRQIKPDGTFFCLLGENLDAAWSYMCVNSPYLDHLCEHIEEVVKTFPDADGLWLDIIKQEQCCCVHCRASMAEKGLDFKVEADRLIHRKQVLDMYLERSVAAAKKHNPNMGVFHNTSMVPRGDRDFFDYFSHLEIEAVPTGGWGYDHLPMSAKYLGAMGYDPLGVTVRFHVVWGELHGYKPTEALRFEAMTMLAHGARVCIGDQLDPLGDLDESAYNMIGDVFDEVERKEPFCTNTTNVADIAILSSSAVRLPGEISREERHCPEDEGALKVLQEGHYLFDVVDQHSDFSGYKLLVLPDRVPLDEALGEKLTAYTNAGGRLLLSGQSGFKPDQSGFAIDTGAQLLGPSPFDPTFVLADEALRPEGVEGPFVIMGPSLRVQPGEGAQALGDVYEPYFNRTPHHFNGHIHAPAKTDPSGFACGVRKDNVAYLPHFVFSSYRALGPHTVKAYVQGVINSMIGDELSATITDFPASGTITVRHQSEKNRYLVHLLYGAPRLKGQTPLGALEAIEDLPRLAPAQVTLNLSRSITGVKTLDGEAIAFEQDDDGKVRFETGTIHGHEMYIVEHD